MEMLTYLIDPHGHQILQDHLRGLFDDRMEGAGHFVIIKRKLGGKKGRLFFLTEEFRQFLGGEPVGKTNLCQLALLQDFGHPQGDFYGHSSHKGTCRLLKRRGKEWQLGGVVKGRNHCNQCIVRTKGGLVAEIETGRRGRGRRNWHCFGYVG